MVAAGEMRHRIAFEKRGDADDGYGNTQTAGFVEQFVVWAKLQARFGGEAITAARLSGRQPVTITVRQSTDTRLITTDWRARDVHSGEIYNIRSKVDPDDRKADLEFLCESGVAT